MPDYSKGYIYKIVCKDISVRNIYIGSSADSYRKSKHKSACNKETGKKRNQKLYKFIRAHGGWDNWKLVELYKYPCNYKSELEQEECWAWDKYSYYYEMLNDRKPYQTEDERKAYLNKKSKEWHQNNLEKARQSARDRAEANREKNLTPEKCECGLMITHGNMPKHIGRERHKKRMTALAAGIEIDDTPKCKKKTECECGAVVVNINRHKKESCPLRHSSA